MDGQFRALEFDPATTTAEVIFSNTKINKSLKHLMNR